MPLPPPRRRSRSLVIAALTAGAVTLVALAVVVTTVLVGPDRPEEDTAERFLAAMLAGDGAAAYALTAPDYRTVVLVSDLEALADALRDVVGDAPTVELLGSERSPDGRGVVSLVGYRGSTAAGRVEGVVTAVRAADDAPFLVRDLSYRFPEAPRGALADLDALTRQLNEAVADRVSRLTVPTPEP